MEYWSEYPQTHLILAAVHLDRKGRGAKKDSSLSEVQDVSMMFGLQAEKMPDAIADAVKWAEEQKQKKKLN